MEHMNLSLAGRGWRRIPQNGSSIQIGVLSCAALRLGICASVAQEPPIQKEIQVSTPSQMEFSKTMKILRCASERHRKARIPNKKLAVKHRSDLYACSA